MKVRDINNNPPEDGVKIYIPKASSADGTAKPVSGEVLTENESVKIYSIKSSADRK